MRKRFAESFNVTSSLQLNLKASAAPIILLDKRKIDNTRLLYSPMPGPHHPWALFGTNKKFQSLSVMARAQISEFLSMRLTPWLVLLWNWRRLHSSNGCFVHSKDIFETDAFSKEYLIDRSPPCEHHEHWNRIFESLHYTGIGSGTTNITGRINAFWLASLHPQANPIHFGWYGCYYQFNLHYSYYKYIGPCLKNYLPYKFYRTNDS